MVGRRPDRGAKGLPDAVFEEARQHQVLVLRLVSVASLVVMLAGAACDGTAPHVLGDDGGVDAAPIPDARALYDDPSLVSLVPSLGEISPAFASARTMYTLALPPGALAVTFTPAVAEPTRGSIRVNGTVVESGRPSPEARLSGFAPVPVTITVTTESGATRTYTVVVSRGSAYVKASKASTFDWFGLAVAMSADGSTLAVGAPNENSSATGIGGDQTNDGALSAGAVYVFTRAGATWSQQAYVKASNTGTDDWFGWALALSGDGSTLAVSAFQEDSDATGVDGDQTNDRATNSGAAYVFTRAGATWSQQAYIKASNTDAYDLFGRTGIALSADGSTLAVGAIDEDSRATGIGGDQTDNSVTGAGAVYVFTRSGATWSQQAYVKASNTDYSLQFGNAVALSADGSTLVVGAPGEASNARGVGGDQTSRGIAGSGAVYVFARAGSTWSQQAYVKASNTGSGDLFGRALALSADGSTLAVGARDEDSRAVGIDGDQMDNAAVDSGAVYTFARTAGVWSQQAYVKASNTDPNDHFGYSLALSADGSTLVIGADGEASNASGIGGDQTNNRASGAGAVYVFSRIAGVWSQHAYVKASNTELGDQFGTVALSADGLTLAVGALLEDANAGAVYVF